MNKKIYIAINDTDMSKSIEDFQTMQANDIQNLFSCSIDMIYVESFNFLSQNIAVPFLETILDKIKPGGQCLIKLIDIKKICNLYSNGSISEEAFFQYIKQANNSINVMSILSYCNNKNYKIIDTKKSELTTIVSISKTGI